MSVETTVPPQFATWEDWVNYLTASLEESQDLLFEARAGICEFIVAMDKEMKGPATFERGQRIALLLNQLQRYSGYPPAAAA